MRNRWRRVEPAPQGPRGAVQQPRADRRLPAVRESTPFRVSRNRARAVAPDRREMKELFADPRFPLPEDRDSVGRAVSEEKD